jgi:hypothetical protein
MTNERVVVIDGNRWVNAPFARSLERELNAANKRIKQLEEALEATAMIIGPPGHSEWATDDEINRAWVLYVQTKEAKL